MPSKYYVVIVQYQEYPPEIEFYLSEDKYTAALQHSNIVRYIDRVEIEERPENLEELETLLIGHDAMLVVKEIPPCPSR